MGYFLLRQGQLLELFSQSAALLKVAEWLDLIDGEQWDNFVEDMLHVHYDPAYENCARRDRAESPRVDRLEIEKCDDAHYDRAALQLLQDHDPSCL